MPQFVQNQSQKSLAVANTAALANLIFAAELKLCEETLKSVSQKP